MISKKFCLILCILFLRIAYLYPQQEHYKFEKPVINNGDISKYIYWMTKDKKGFAWFATEEGLYRFDGFNMKRYTHNSNDPGSISDNFVVSVYDDDRYLWVGTYSGGLNRFDKFTEKFQVYKHKPDDHTSISSNMVNMTIITKDNEMWIGTDDGLNKFDRATEKFIRFKKNSEDSLSSPGFDFIYNLFEDSQGLLWIGGSGGGLDCYNRKINKFTHYKNDPNDLFSLSYNYVTDFIEDDSGNIWISTYSGGVNKFNRGSERFYRFNHDSLNENSLIGRIIVTMAKDKKNRIWFGGSDGISIYDPAENIFTNLKKDDNVNLSELSKIYIEENGIVWACSNIEGFSILNLNKKKLEHIIVSDENTDKGLPKSVFSMCQDIDGNIWIGTVNGIYVQENVDDTNKIKFKDSNEFFSPGRNVITHIFRDSKNNMWISKLGILKKFNYETKEFADIYTFDNKNYGYSITEDAGGNIWVGLMQDGIRVFDSNGSLIKSYFSGNDGVNFKDLWIYNLFHDSKGNLWISTFQGLIKFDKKTEELIRYIPVHNDSNSISSDEVVSVTEDKTGYIWIATNGGGLNCFDPAKKIFTKYLEEDGLGSNVIRSMLMDNSGNIWMSTSMGITKFETHRKLFANYGMEDGVQGIEFYSESCYKASDGKLYFGGDEGYNGFYPDSIPENRNIPAIVLTGIKIFNKEVKLDTSITEKKEITIPYNENFFSFEYAALDFTDPAKNQHAYKLEGVDKDWNYVGNIRTVNYTDIAPGNYTFRVKGSNNNGVWNEEGTSIRLIIPSPWYKTFWFNGFLVLSIIGGIGFAFKKRIQKLNKEKLQQEEFTKKLIESQENERKRVAAELHDSLGQDLLIIKNKALISIKKTKDFDQLKKEMNEISDLTSATLNDVREISYNLRPYELDRLGLTKTIESMIERANNSTNINFAANIDDIDKVFIPEVEINIYRIIQESLNNVIKHSEASEVNLIINRSEKEIVISISDNGKGFDLKKYRMKAGKKGFGLKGIEERVRLLNGEFNIESEVGKSTTVRIIIPLSK